MPQVTFSVTITNGSGDASVMVFNNMVSYEHYFPQSGVWRPFLDEGSYLLSLSGTCPPGGTVTINISGIQACSRKLPIVINKSGTFLLGASIRA